MCVSNLDKKDSGGNEHLQRAQEALHQKHYEELLGELKNAAVNLKNIQELTRFSNLFKAIPPEVLSSAKFRRVSVAVGGNSTLKLLLNSLEAELLSEGILVDGLELPFDQWAQELLNENSEFYRASPSFFVFYLSHMGMTRGGSQPCDYQATVNLIVNVFQVLINRLPGIQVVFVLPEASQDEFYDWSEEGARRLRFIVELCDKFSGRFIFIDPASTISHIGAPQWYAARYWYVSKMPCHPNAFLPLGRKIGDVVSRCLNNPLKVVVCDLDNFLWGGIVGENGVEGLDLDGNAMGGAYLRLQSFLKRIKNRGILLAIASKNNELDALEVFEKRTEMVLKLEDFASHRINWRPKPDNLREMAEELNLRLENFCFLDDSPHEREFVRQQLPEVLVPELPSNPDEVVPYLLKSRLFSVPKVTEEDQRRTELYRQERKRKEHQISFSDLNEYLKSLAMELDVTPVGDQNLERVTQLINKTNQFNLTTRRYSSEEVRRFAGKADYYFFCVRLKDKFGDSGLIGTLLAVPEAKGPHAYRVDTWLLSCRAMGRHVEYAMIHHFAQWALARGVKKVVSHFIRTPKNAVVETLYATLGFCLTEAQQETYSYEWDLSRQKLKLPDLSCFNLKTSV